MQDTEIVGQGEPFDRVVILEGADLHAPTFLHHAGIDKAGMSVG